jgi:hypothetical protein
LTGWCRWNFQGGAIWAKACREGGCIPRCTGLPLFSSLSVRSPLLVYPFFTSSIHQTLIPQDWKDSRWSQSLL